MYNRLLNTLAATAVIIALGSSVVLMQQPANAADDPVSSAPDPMQFARGAQGWANTCARCHNMRDPKELRDDQWRAAVAHMRVRAGLTGQEARDILAFLQGSN
jgi:cytochrome c5